MDVECGTPVAPKLHHLQSKGISRVDDPDKEETLCLQKRNGHTDNFPVAQLRVPQGHSAGWCSRRELPRRIHHDHVKLAPLAQFLRVIE